MSGPVGEWLKTKGFNKTKLEILSIGITLLFFITLIWFAYESALLEGRCKATLLTGEEVKYDPNDPPNFTEQLIFINLSKDNCTRETLSYDAWVCNYTFDYDECWVGFC